MSDWIKTAKVGDKVVCVDATAGPIQGVVYWRLVEGGVYTIAEITDEFSVIAIAVKEMPAELEGGFLRAERFRPVEPRKTDISIFTDVLKTVGKRVPEDA